MIVLDTDHLTVLADTRDLRNEILRERLGSADDSVSCTIVNVEEVFRGWLAYIHRQREVHRQISAYLRLLQFIDFLKNWQIIPFNESAADQFMLLRRLRIRIGAMDLKIAAIALANNALLVTANSQDFGLVPNLRYENWLE